MTAMHPADGTYRNTLIRITDLTVTNDVVEGVTFENCTIVGPAVIAPLGSTAIRNCRWDGDAVGIIWSIGDRDHIIGAVGLLNCTVVNCAFQRIGIAVPEDQVETVRRGFGL